MSQQTDYLELIKIPLSQNKPETIKLIKDHRQKLADTFFDKTKSAEERNKLIPELNAINKYFSYKEVYEIKIAGKGGGTYTASAAQRKENCEAFKAYLGSAFQALTPFEQAVALANIWGSWKQ